MANPNVPQGVLNRLRASLIIPAFPALNVTPSFLMPEAIQTSFQGALTTNLQTMTGVVASPEPYVLGRSMVHLIKAQALAEAWRQQMEADCRLGDITVRPDSVAVSPFEIGNVSIVALEQLSFGGRDAGFVVAIEGTWNVNANYWL